ncbi:UDP-N-acetylglucosamine diphosphorylase 2-like isoform X3 [Hibiscus syriacus]|uniref:UDP-N-acetylglucosamine diphosphorylase 2-like isoform X3 n=1 Tax=Hibiscus syriacus TaxID=106335 RepID=UPI001923353A|nr:UDP-N-acetylglucosamine diphosphorylase 2-like isoform X3 [Hibiscus syriacus]
MGESTVAMGIDNDAGAAPNAPPQQLMERLKDYGQEHVFALWDELSPQERHLLLNDIQSLDLSRIDRIIRCSLRSHGLSVAAIEPVPESCVSSVEERTMEERERWWKMGLKAISEGKLAVLLLSGGQGTRLGSSDPKGCFNIGLPSGKSLFQLQAERILCVQRLATHAMNEGSAGSVAINWYIMTSPFTDDATRKFFESHKYFGLEADQVTFFQQGTIPCISKDGRYIMDTPYKVAKAPDGNGGVYSALKSSRLLEDMASRGIKYVDCYGVDNALVRVADPTFLGYFIDKGVAAAAKVVRKAYPQEKVGVFVRRGKGGPLTVVEYSELDQSLASAVNQQTGRLRFCWSNVCLHMFTLDFLNQVANGLEKDSMFVCCMIDAFPLFTPFVELKTNPIVKCLLFPANYPFNLKDIILYINFC